MTVSVAPASITPAPTALASTQSVVLLAVRPGLWRVSHHTGMVLGHIELQADAQGDCFTARRRSQNGLEFDLGRFWRLTDATDCFR